MRANLPGDLVERQAGVIGRGQAMRAGLPRDVIDGMVRTGRWQRLQRGVYATFSGEPGRDAVLWAAILRAGPLAMVSHHTAAGLSGLTDYPGGLVHVIVPPDRRPRPIPGAIVHRLDRPRTARHPVLLPPRTRIEETVLDLVTTADSADDAFGWVFRATGRGLTTAERIRRAMATRQRMPWRAELTACLDDNEAGVRSNLEHRYVLAVERPHGLPRAERQARVVRAGRMAYLDNLYRPYRVGVELDGRAAHPVGERWRDYRRDNAGATDGIITLRYGWSDVTGGPCQVAAQVAAVLTQRGWSGQGRPCGSACAMRPRREQGTLTSPYRLSLLSIINKPWPGRTAAGTARQGCEPMATTQRRKVTQPLGGVTVIFSAVLLAFLALVAVTALLGSNNVFGFGHTFLCANAIGTYGAGNWNASPFGIVARRGANVQVNGTIQACTGFHPAITQRALYALTSLPPWLIWGSVLFLLVRLLIIARREGPFTFRTAAIMQRLGWLLIVGTALAAPIEAIAQHELLNTMITQPESSSAFLYQLLFTLPFTPMIPTNVLVGAALLTFARITRLGAAMDDEIQGTV